MGLDMYAFKARKVTLPDERTKFTKAEVDELFGCCLTIDADEVDMPMYAELKPYLTALTVTNQYIDIAKIKADNGVPEDAHISMESFGCNSIVYGFSSPTVEDKFRVELTKEQLDTYVFDRDDEQYVCEIEEVAYWRKAYETQDLIYDLIESDIENCGFYYMDPGVIETVNETFEEETGIHIPEEDDIFYHEWF